MLRDLEAGTRPLIRYLAPHLEIELQLEPATRGGSVERPGGQDRGGLNDDGGGDVDGDADNMARHQKWVAYKKDNKLRPGDGGKCCSIISSTGRDRKWGEKLPSLLTKEEDTSQEEEEVWEEKDRGE